MSRVCCVKGLKAVVVERRKTIMKVGLGVKGLWVWWIGATKASVSGLEEEVRVGGGFKSNFKLEAWGMEEMLAGGVGDSSEVIGMVELGKRWRKDNNGTVKVHAC